MTPVSVMNAMMTTRAIWNLTSMRCRQRSGGVQGIPSVSLLAIYMVYNLVVRIANEDDRREWELEQQELAREKKRRKSTH